MRDFLDVIGPEMPSIMDLVERLVRHESPTFDKSATDAMAQLLHTEMSILVEGRFDRLPNARYGDSLRMRCGEVGRRILILGHFDTVHDRGALELNPFRLVDGRAYGPGILDMKAGIVQAIFAMKALQSTGRAEGAQVTFLLTADEEIGSPTSRELICEEARAADVCFVLEPGAGASGSLKTARKGVGTYTLSVVGKAAHAGLDPGSGINAIEEISRQILWLQSLNDNRHGVTVNCGLVRGGTSKNTVPERADVTVDVRAPSRAAADWIDAEIREARVFAPGAQLSVGGGMSRPPMPETETVRGLAGLARRLMEDAGRSIESVAVGGASDANFAAEHVPTLDGLGAVGAGAHTSGEYIETAHVVERSALLAAILAHTARQEAVR